MTTTLSMKLGKLKEAVLKLHRNEKGAVSLETILIIGAIAIPILIFLLKYGWPKVRDYFYNGLDSLEDASDNVQNNSGTTTN